MKTVEPAACAARRGNVADQLADQDPLATPARCLEKLRSVPMPAGVEPLSDSRLFRLWAADTFRCGAVAVDLAMRLTSPGDRVSGGCP